VPVTLVVGAQWGDEGKGRIIDWLSSSASVVARFGGGANAGHTVRVGERTYKLRIVPSGVIAGVEHCIIGPGTVVSPSSLIAELESLRAGGVDVSHVWLSDLAHLILPYHIELDASSERSLGGAALGTTGNGIGPAYVDRAARTGIRAGDLADMPRCLEMLAARTQTARAAGAAVDLKVMTSDLTRHAQALLPHVRDTVSLLHDQLEAGKRVLAEGAQGTLLDVNLGTYPFVTSSVTVSGGACTGLGFGPKEVEHVVGVAKAYCTRVGAGPFPSELNDDTGEALRERGLEFGVVTGRPRRCGWLDLAALRYAVQINGLTHLAMTKLDVLDGFAEISVGVGYEGQDASAFPFVLARGAKPRYKQLRGWSQPTSGARAWEQLPSAARDYVEFVESHTRTPISYVSVGPERSQIIVRPGAPQLS